MSFQEPNRSNSFVHLVDDGTLSSPRAVGVGRNELVMSDDEGKIITTLESPKAAPSSDKAEVTGASKNEGLLTQMKSRLSKQIELKKVLSNPKPPSTASSKPLDVSGSIEIPQDLILSSDIPATPLTAGEAKELEDDDLIAILEGDDVEITENATEIEVRVGGSNDGDYTDEVLEEIQISFFDEQDIQNDKTKEKEAAARQLASLPIFAKGRKPKPKPEKMSEQQSKPERKPEPQSKPEGPVPVKPKPKETYATAILRGQTTITPIPRPMLIPKEEPLDSPSTAKILTVSKNPSPIKSPITPLATQKSSPRAVDVVEKQTSKELISSLVSDWDDDPTLPVPLKEEPNSPALSPPKKAASSPMAPPPLPPTPVSVEEPKRSRIIKKKIIWDPDNPDTHQSFASFVKSNRTKPLPVLPKVSAEAPVISTRVSIPGGIRRKRAESVAVHMIKDTPLFVPPSKVKRATTPEPIIKQPKVLPTNNVRKKKSEIDKLLGDEGAINMLYDIECENSNKDLLKDSNMEVDDEDEKLLAKAKIISDAIKQTTSPNEVAVHTSRARAKRASTPQQTSTSPAPTPIPTATTSTVKKAGPGRKRKQILNKSADWDYVYKSQQTCEDAMIIRRRSNSSYSSSTSPRRLSFDQPPTTNLQESAEETKSKGFQFVKPPSKPSTKPSENIKVDSSLVTNMKGKLSKVLGSKLKKEAGETPPQEKKPKQIPSKQKPMSVGTETSPSTSGTVLATTTTTMVRVEENGINSQDGPESLQEKLKDLKLNEITCRSCGNYTEIVLAPQETKLKDVFTIELMNEVKAVLNLLKTDVNTRAVLIRSNGKQFCRGLDVSYLIQTNAEKRKNAAQILSGHLRNFLQTLALFNKPLVAAVQGDVLGLGVTILPLFEMVIAADNTSFCTPYTIFGQLPEAMKIFTSYKNLKPKAITDLLYLSKKIMAPTALDYGIVTEVVNPEKLTDKANNITKKLASLSSQALKSMKVNLRQQLSLRLDEILVAEQKKLIQHWTTAECQEKFKQFVARGGEW
ncbi:titin isoform X2 [Uranotaenia lowii]|uniref:titin isoform X2 n=1 Tax=Uranotaenia lowii TaxID=190385 RepID=UPI00247854B6|nr:titin isoform X2 [Uranotaenia lowii]